MLYDVAYPLLGGRAFREARYLARASDRWSADECEAYQVKRLRIVLTAYAQTPFGKKQLTTADAQTIRSVDELQSLPIVTREHLLAEPEAFLVPGVTPRWTSTAGSTGQPVRLHIPEELSRAEWAYMLAGWRRTGYVPDAPRAVLRGQVIDGFATRDWRRNAWILNFYRFGELGPAPYVEFIRRHRIRWLHAYPSSATQFATGCAQAELTPRLEGVLCGSETMTPGGRSAVEEVFGVRCFTWYGHTEKALLGHECEFSPDYHLFPTYGVAEIAPGYDLETRGRLGRILATGLLNTQMPLVRYETGDLGIIRSENLCPCGRRFQRIATVVGRLQEHVVLPSGQTISIAAINLHDDSLRGVTRYQLVQLGTTLEFRYEAQSELDLKTQDEISAALGPKLPGLELRFVLGRLIRSPSGKCPLIVRG